MQGLELLKAVWDHRQNNRPRNWIAREVNVPYEDVCAVLRAAGDTTRDSKLTLERYDALCAAVEDEWSLSEIRKTLGFDHRTVHRWFPDYNPNPQGFSAHSRMVRKGNELLNGLELK